MTLPYCGLFIGRGERLPGKASVLQGTLGILLALLGSLAIPVHRLCLIPNHALTMGITNAKVILCVRIPLFSGLAIPFHPFNFISRNAHSITVTIAQIVLRPGASLFSTLSKPVDCLSCIPFNTIAK